MATTHTAHPHLRTQPAVRDEAVSEAVATPHLLSLLRFVAAMTVLLAAAAFPHSAFFTIRQITVAGTRQVDPEEVLALSGVRAGMPLFSQSARQIAARVGQHPRITSASLHLRPPDRVVIRTAERSALAAFPHRGGVLLLDRFGVAMGWQPMPDGLVLISADGAMLPWVRLGDRLPSAAAMRMIDAVQLLEADAIGTGARLRMDASGDLTLMTGDGIAVLLGQLRGLAARAAVLPQVLAAVRARGAGIEYLDLRFTGSVAFKPRPSGAAKGGVGP